MSFNTRSRDYRFKKNIQDFEAMSNQRSIKQFAQRNSTLELYIIDKLAEVKLQCLF